jgi:hypothetical protein
MNQFRGYWLLTNALFIAITMSCKLNEEPKMNHFLDNSMEKDVVVAIELDLLASNIKGEVCNILDAFLSFFKKFDERIVHNMLALMLDLR